MFLKVFWGVGGGGGENGVDIIAEKAIEKWLLSKYQEISLGYWQMGIVWR